MEMNLKEGRRKRNRRRQIERENSGQRRPAGVARREAKEGVGGASRGPGVRRRMEGDKILE
jgi:hypothetical protein